MKVIRIARDGMTYHTNTGHKTEHTFSLDESQLRELSALRGVLQADDEQRFAGGGTSTYEDDTEEGEYLPSENYLG